MINTILINRYAELTDLSLVIRSSHRMIGKALEHGLKSSHLTSSYLMLGLCFKEYCYATNLAVEQFGAEEFDVIRCYYNRLATENSDRQLIIFALSEIRPILEQVGGCIRLIVSAEELSIGLTT